MREVSFARRIASSSVMAGPRKNAVGGNRAKKARVCNADAVAQHVAFALANGAQAEKDFVIERMEFAPCFSMLMAWLG